MTTVDQGDSSRADDGDPLAFEDHEDSLNVLAVASIALSGLGFLTLLRLADRRDRAPASALGLFFTTSLATITGTAFGLMAARHASDSEQPGKELLLGGSGAVLGIITALMNINWMRTRRRL
jgi:uncharacterized BrkB/YihY/UPF0761 family membrane protein